MHRLSLIATVTACGAMASSAFGGDLEITVGSIRNGTGTVRVALHPEAGARTFPDLKGAVAAQWVQATPGAHRFVFTDLSAGRFAAAVFHDENNNGEFDNDFLGTPTEGYGFSRNAAGSFGPPRFGDAAVDVAAGGKTVRTTVNLTY